MTLSSSRVTLGMRAPLLDPGGVLDTDRPVMRHTTYTRNIRLQNCCLRHRCSTSAFPAGFTAGYPDDHD